MACFSSHLQAVWHQSPFSWLLYTSLPLWAICSLRPHSYLPSVHLSHRAVTICLSGSLLWVQSSCSIHYCCLSSAYQNDTKRFLTSMYGKERNSTQMFTHLFPKFRPAAISSWQATNYQLACPASVEPQSQGCGSPTSVCTRPTTAPKSSSTGHPLT